MSIGRAPAQVPTALPAPEVQWTRTYGTVGANVLQCVRPAADGGYWLGGWNDAWDGGDRSEPSRGKEDYWIMKIDPSGHKQWDRTFGGQEADVLHDLQPTADGGCIIGGESSSGSGGDKTHSSRGLSDYWLIKLDAQGNKHWDRTLGGAGKDILWNLQQTTDGGYIVAGTSTSAMSGDKTEDYINNTAGDYWVVKLNAQGQQEWDRTVGGNQYEWLRVVRQTRDGGYILGGESNSGIGGDKSELSRGLYDQWVVKLNATGQKQWDRTFGGYQDEYLMDILLTPDGGYLLGGTSESSDSGDKSQPSHANSGDYWLVKVDAQGRKQWDRQYGGIGYDQLSALQLTANQGYLLGGWSFSTTSGEKHAAARGHEDAWIVQVDASGTLQWDQTVGDAGSDVLHSLLVTADDKFMGVGTTNSAAFVSPKPPGHELKPDWWVFQVDPTPPRVRITGDTLLCAGGQLLLTADAAPGAVSYSWSTGATTPTMEVKQAGSYQVTATFADGQRRTARQTIHAFTPTLLLQGDTVLCPDQSLQLVAGGTPAASYAWSTGATTSSIVVTQPGRYTLTARYSSGCELTQQLVLRTPTLHLLGSPLLCARTGSQTTLEARAPGAVAYRWNTGDTTASLVVTTPGSYSVVATFATGCTRTATAQVVVPEVTILGDSVLCPGQSVQLSAGGCQALSYQWSTGATTATIRVQEPGTYSLTATYASGCSRSVTMHVRASFPLPAISWDRDTTLCAGTTLLLQAPLSPQPLAYRWSDGSTGSSLVVSTAGTYSLTVKSPCEERTYRRHIDVKSCVFLPNIVTANGDGRNDYFAPTGLVGGKWKLSVYNRWGRQVYEAASYANDWGKDAAAGTYYYLLQQANTGVRYKGTVEVIR